jgi:hypothetical protein
VCVRERLVVLRDDRRKRGRLSAKILFAIRPIIAVVVIAAYLAKAFQLGRIRGRFVTYNRADDPLRFWTPVSVYALFAVVSAVGLNGYLSP